MDNIFYFKDYKTRVLSDISRSYVKCIRAEIRLEEQTTPDWLNNLECDGLCNSCQFVNCCIGMDFAIPIHLI